MGNELRPCTVDGQKALFHKWDVKEQIFIKFNSLVRKDEMLEVKNHIETDHIVPEVNDLVKVSNTYALVEFEDGSVKYVDPENVKFFKESDT